ncbi:hypothetical protein [Bdellovibrio sp. HCB337]|uniref:hypothetical protein n=1 Tax=Bdellovibrio sp. HCB337 TaxID=3394358 RepID=UPI0039A595A3
MKRLLLSVITCSVVLFMSASAFAQEEEAAPAAPSSGAAPKRAKGTRTQKLNFEDELVEGGTQKPELFYLFQKKNFNYKRLIKLRQNFIPEMRKTSEDIQRIRGGT